MIVKFYFIPRGLFFLLFVLQFIVNSMAQDLSDINTANPFLIAGNVNMTQTLRYGNDYSIENPYTSIYSVNLNCKVLGWSIPVSGIYSNREFNYSHPFNRLSLSPSFKWIKTRVGHTSMTFSPYTLSGHSFTGGGIELSPPGKFTMSAMAGRLKKAMEADTVHQTENAFARWGYGISGDFNYKSVNLGASFFYAKDNGGSEINVVDSSLVNPMENLASSFRLQTTLFKNLTLKGEYGISLLTSNIYQEKSGNRFRFMQRNQSSAAHHAYKINFTYQSLLGAFSASMEHVDPGYKTLGAYYFVNDFVNYTLGYAAAFLQNKINLSFTGGLQEDNLSNTLSTGNRRKVGAISLAIVPVKPLNLQFNYSAFNDYTHIADPLEEVGRVVPWIEEDTLTFTQVSESASAGLSWNIEQKENATQFLSLNTTLQKTATGQQGNTKSEGTEIFNLMGAYNLSFTKQKLSLSATFSLSCNESAVLNTTLYGPGLSLRQQLFSGLLSVNLSGSHHQSLQQNIPARPGEPIRQISSITVLRGAASLNFKKTHQLTITPALAFRKKSKNTRNNDGSVVVRYGCRFGKKNDY